MSSLLRHAGRRIAGHQLRGDAGSLSRSPLLPNLSSSASASSSTQTTRHLASSSTNRGGDDAPSSIAGSSAAEAAGGLGGNNGGNDANVVFDRDMKRNQRDRAATAGDSPDYDYIYTEVARRVADRVSDVSRSFPTALDLGCHGGTLGRLLEERGNVDTLIQLDSSETLLRRDAGANAAAAAEAGNRRVITAVVDEEYLPIAPASVDLALSSLSLHWINDLTGTLTQVRK
jgi:hypothetical protein